LADTLFVDATVSVPGTPLVAAWHNDVNSDVYNTLTAVAGTDTITGTGPLSLTAYASGKWFKFVPANTNTGAVTLNISGLGARAVTKYGSTALIAGDLVVGMEAILVDDGTRLQLINPKNVDVSTATGTLPIANGGTGATTVAGALSNLGLVTQPTFRNLLLNGDMFINILQQVAATTTGAYFVDGWSTSNTATARLTSVQSTANAAPGFPFSLLSTVTTAGAPAAGDFHLHNQGIEGTFTRHLSWGTASAATITISLQVRSSVAGTFALALRNGVANRSYVTPLVVNNANTWETKTFTIPGDQSGSWVTTTAINISVSVCMAAGTTFQTSTLNAWQAGNFVAPTTQTQLTSTNGATFQITGVQFEAGSVATTYERIPFDLALTRCQRYFESSYPYGVAPGTATADGQHRIPAFDANILLSLAPTFKVQKANAPGGAIMYNPATGAINSVRNTTAGTAVAITASVAGQWGFNQPTSAAGFVAGQYYEFQYIVNARI
jgi:hypothetical protein